MTEKLLEQDRGEVRVMTSKGNWSVEREVASFFKDYPFLLVSEKRLASLLCRPLEMVEEAVVALEKTGFLTRKGEETLLCTEDYMAGVLSE
jgi:hypothetical protein